MMQSAAYNPISQSLFGNAVIVDLICAYSSPATFIGLSKTCKLALASVRGYMRRAYNINRHLLHWFADPAAFRALQARTATLISGSNALQFFDRTVYTTADLDLFTPREHMLEIAEWLIWVGYSFVPTPAQLAGAGAHRREIKLIKELEKELDDSHVELDAYKNFSCAMKVYTFSKASADGSRPLKVQIVGSNVPPIAAILHFHSTCVMNAISSSAAYSLYPRATFESRCSLVCPTDGLDQGPALQKYARRGWDMVSPSNTADPVEASFAAGPRWIDDEMTWVIQLSPLNNPAVRADPDPVACTHWRLCYRETGDGDGTQPLASMSAVRFAHPCLSRVYVFPTFSDDRGHHGIVGTLNKLFEWIERAVFGKVLERRRKPVEDNDEDCAIVPSPAEVQGEEATAAGTPSVGRRFGL
ncbi:hypothetical protein BV25DRAFT_782845 [Artomyces pyxidatus]|uniref:Uncharacterized protein n=1 Tax=Artomyces pyxidatus TaxID=48021 RepID=A0ACB8T061_9AGAM|nr:hypothetical protein BV25DRAFT_782845 [Artomyces pyxidatus]